MSIEMKRLKKEGAVVQSLSRVRLFETPWTGARQASGPYSTGKFPRAEGIAAGYLSSTSSQRCRQVSAPVRQEFGKQEVGGSSPFAVICFLYEI